MKERPILFNSEMVRAVLDGRKTQTRRVVKPRSLILPDGGLNTDAIPQSVWRRANRELPPAWGLTYCCPYGQPGDQLWVRETHSLREYSGDQIEEWQDAWYWADGNPDFGNWTRPRPSIHMPRWASRITLEVTGVRVERVQEISEDDAREEGVRPITDSPRCLDRHSVAFQFLWDSINAKRGFGWDVNPWVWVVEFKVITPTPKGAES